MLTQFALNRWIYFASFISAHYLTQRLAAPANEFGCAPYLPVDYRLLLLLSKSPLFPASQSKQFHTQFYNLCALFLVLAGKTNLLY